MDPAVRDLCARARCHGAAARWHAAPGLGAILATGPEVTSFLQAQLTSDVQTLQPGQGQLSSRLDRRGCLVAWFHLLHLPDRGQPFPSFLMIVDRTHVPVLLNDLQSFVISEDVLLEDASADFGGVLLQGPDSDSLVASPADMLTFPLSLTGDPGLLCLLPHGCGEAALDHLLDAAGQAGWAVLDDDDTGRAVWGSLRVEAGWPRLGVDVLTGKRVLPQTGLEQHVVSWTKGCYLGQEVVARIRTYGSVPQALRGLVLSAPDGPLPEPGTPLTTPQGDKLGQWASWGWSAIHDGPVALAYLDRASRTPGQILEIAGAEGQVLQAEVQLLPLYSAVDQGERAASLHHQAVSLFSRGQDDRAVALLEESLRLDPGNVEACEALGVILGRTERFHEAIDIFRRLEEVAPDEPMVHTNLSLYYMKIGDREEAERQKALGTMKRFGNTDPDQLQQAEQAERLARRQEALRKRKMFTEVLDLDPEDPLALAGMGQVCSDLEQWDEAVRYLDRALAVQQENSPLYLACGKALQQLQRADQAAEIYRRGVEVASRRGDLQPLREMEHRLALLQGAAAGG